MKTQLIKYISLILIAPVAFAEDSLQDLDVEHFQVKVKPGSPVPTGRVYSDDPSKIKYNKSRSASLPYTVEVRGRCPSVSDRLLQFQLKANNQVILTIPVSGENRSLTGNNGKQWQAQNIKVDMPANQNSLIQACNALAGEKTQTQSHDDVFNSNFKTEAVDSGQDVNVSFVCFGGLGFTDWIYDTTSLPIKALCEATGYESVLRITESQVSLNPITGQDGTCKLNISGGFQTNYELYALRSNQSTVDLKYRFKYHGAGQAANTAHSQWWDKTANPINAGAFVFNYTDRLPTNIEGGKISLEVMSNGKLSKSDPQPFSIACVDALPLQQQQTHELALSVKADKAELVAVAGQLCPSHALITAELAAASSLDGKMLIIGSSLPDIYPFDFSVSAGGTSTRQKRVPLNWQEGINNILTADGTVAASNELKTQTLNYGLRVLNSDNELVKQLAKSPYQISCELPSVNPGVVGNASALTTADNTPGLNKQSKPKSGQNLKKHELSHATQQGRVIIDSDLNEQSQAKRKNQKPQAANKNRLSNSSKDQQKYNVPLTNATISSVSSEQLNRQNKPTLVKAKVGSRCNKIKFPKNAVIKQVGRQYVAKCVNNKVQIKRAEKVQREWKLGDPVLIPSQKEINRGKGSTSKGELKPEDQKIQKQDKSSKRNQ